MLGFLKSPIENKILVALIGEEEMEDPEGTEDKYLKFVGCHLDPSTFK